MVAALVVSFASGTTTGILIEKEAFSPPPAKTWEQTQIDGYLRQLERDGVTRQEDRDEARKVLETHYRRLRAMKQEVEKMLLQQIDALSQETEAGIEEIRQRYRTPPDQGR
jgi:hypothetical protein